MEGWIHQAICSLLRELWLGGCLGVGPRKAGIALAEGLCNLGAKSFWLKVRDHYSNTGIYISMASPAFDVTSPSSSRSMKQTLLSTVHLNSKRWRVQSQACNGQRKYQCDQWQKVSSGDSLTKHSIWQRGKYEIVSQCCFEVDSTECWYEESSHHGDSITFNMCQTLIHGEDRCCYWYYTMFH